MSALDWRIISITYNVNTRKPESDQIYQLLQDGDAKDAVIVAIGLQELSHLELFGTIPVETTWLSILTSWMNAHGKSLLCKASLAWNLLLIFAQLEVFPLVSEINSRQSRSSLGGLTGHKGSVSLRIKFRDESSLVFITSHFLPDTSNYEKRCLQYKNGKICAFDDVAGGSNGSNNVIWLGDFNWRVDQLTSQEMIMMLAELNSNNYMDKLVNKFDQLKKAQKSGRAFMEYNEEKIRFAPTYRLMVGSSHYDQERVPSWCDRILFKGKSLRCERYESNHMVTLSDHFPVYAHFILSEPVSRQHSGWKVRFEKIPHWYNIVPFTCRFTYLDDFWNISGSYRDWVAIYLADVPNSLQPLTWLYVVACYNTIIANRSVTIAEFPCLSAGHYRVGYFSTYKNCLQGLSDIFEVGFIK
ncbi:endonuclease/Exonuclease/phosphatase [Loa loa]|uniref:Endonuclease/Exonuclease/phosphatase n=1 Tax=Loa loa TaxID=7209 RepID=A0A1I7VK69_LOALO|nr:endonuclease/Exonuclease/phosphatase [Loa loa]EFO26968.1 endonuclease/Exonuclease/phosphatase [Loa loa]